MYYISLITNLYEETLKFGIFIIKTSDSRFYIYKLLDTFNQCNYINFHFYNVYMKNRIKSLRIEKGLSQTELSEQIGCTQQSLSKIENGIQVPGVDLAFKIADFFNVTVEFLYYETNFSGSIKTDQEFNEFTEHLQRLMKYLKL